MSVYVDNEKHKVGRMEVCHMFADTCGELHGMADSIGIPRRYVQVSRTGIIHYDVCKSKRALAIELGAKEIDRSGVAILCKRLKAEANSVDK